MPTLTPDKDPRIGRRYLVTEGEYTGMTLAVKAITSAAEVYKNPHFGRSPIFVLENDGLVFPAWVREVG